MQLYTQYFALAGGKGAWCAANPVGGPSSRPINQCAGTPCLGCLLACSGCPEAKHACQCLLRTCCWSFCRCIDACALLCRRVSLRGSLRNVEKEPALRWPPSLLCILLPVAGCTSRHSGNIKSSSPSALGTELYLSLHVQHSLLQCLCALLNTIALTLYVPFIVTSGHGDMIVTPAAGVLLE